jgi:2-polyprenyl-3-methyl-5-hydroxy-6-metoxy-1,4-benzoquinol methylase
MQTGNKSHTGKAEKVEEYFTSKSRDFCLFNSIVELRAEIVHHLLGNILGCKIIDIGCGNGKISTQFLGQNKVTYLEISSGMLEKIATSIPPSFRNNAEFINADFLETHLNDKFDVIICLGVYSHVSDVDLLTRKLGSIMNDEGRIIIQFTDNKKLTAKLNIFKNRIIRRRKYPYQVNRTDFNQIEKIVKENGLKIIQSIRYWPFSPVFSLFSERAKLNFIRFSAKNRLLSSFGSEVILLLKRQN